MAGGFTRAREELEKQLEGVETETEISCTSLSAKKI
jgi:hypothetical protein